MEDGSFLRMNLKMPLNGRGQDHVTQYRNCGTPLITGKTSKVIYMNINYNKLANIRDKNLKVYNDV